MPYFTVTDEVYEVVKARAEAAGFATADDYVSAVLADEFGVVGEDVGFLFTPERLAKIDAAVAEVEAGQVVTMEQARADLAEYREAWLREHGR